MVRSTNRNATVSKIKHLQFQKLVSTKRLYVPDAEEVKYTLGGQEKHKKVLSTGCLNSLGSLEIDLLPQYNYVSTNRRTSAAYFDSKS